jgi:hypothetical protein
LLLIDRPLIDLEEWQLLSANNIKQGKINCTLFFILKNFRVVIRSDFMSHFNKDEDNQKGILIF